MVCSESSLDDDDVKSKLKRQGLENVDAVNMGILWY